MMYPIPVTIVPANIKMRNPYLSSAHPVIGPSTPFSARASENASEVCHAVRFRLSDTGMKKTVKPCQRTDPPSPFMTAAPASRYQPK